MQPTLVIRLLAPLGSRRPVVLQYTSDLAVHYLLQLSWEVRAPLDYPSGS